MFYSGPQLKLLLALTATLLIGLGVREWRAGFPDLAERLERFDREDAAALLPPPTAGPEQRPARFDKPVANRPVDAPSRQEERAAPAAAAPADPRPLDINRATAAELARLPGVGPGLADRILAERERRGRFDSPEALRYVLGMGPKKLAAIREMVTVVE